MAAGDPGRGFVQGPCRHFYASFFRKNLPAITRKRGGKKPSFSLFTPLYSVAPY